MGLKLRLRTGVAVSSAMVVAGVLAPSALASTPLSGNKTAEVSWTRSYDWTISKTVDKPSIELKSGESTSAKYTVAVTKSAGTDSMSVTGQICVMNNGDIATEGLAIRDILRAFDAGGNTIFLNETAVDVSGNPVLDPGEEHCYAYSLPFTPVAGAVSYQNRARATITNDPREPGAELGPVFDAPFEVPVSPTPINDTIDVDDTNGLSWQFSSSGSQTYNRTFACDQDKGTHVNTATIEQTGANASATVTVTCKQKQQECKDKGNKGKGYQGDDCKDRDDKDHDWKGKDDKGKDDKGKDKGKDDKGKDKGKDGKGKDDKGKDKGKDGKGKDNRRSWCD